MRVTLLISMSMATVALSALANPLTALTIRDETMVAAVRIPVRLTYDNHFVVYSEQRFNTLTDGRWKPEQQTFERALTFKYIDKLLKKTMLLRWLMSM